MTPQEAWSGRKPGIAHLRVFGSKAYAHVPDQTSSKLDDKSKPFIFIGYDSNTKGYKLYDPTSQKTMTSRDVEFDEEGVWDFGSDNDTTSIPPFGDPRIDEQIREEQQEQTTPPASPATSVGGSPPSFLNERATQRARNLAEVYDDTESDSDWAGDNDDRKSTSGYVFYMGDTAFTWISVWGMTPQEAWSGKKPGIAHLRVFGSKAYAHVPDQTRSKLDDKSKPFIFIGYDSNTKGYKLYDPTSQKTMTSRDVEFDEE
ncbi:hypothetical protein SASPL_126636 [Salvia splendens]|uniref:Retroviral polymerase SH3-like domain-containing protein n=1 Tax=Salvia splendens TaxID=180675 RepID=A0A8X8ZRC4_SALSN|nr:hypothetical protein SASPL_126636 [Salvia splendens]